MLVAILSLTIGLAHQPEARSLGVETALELEPDEPAVPNVLKAIDGITRTLEGSAALTRRERARLLETLASLHFIWEDYGKASAGYAAALRADPGNHAAEARLLLARELAGHGKDTIRRLELLAAKHPGCGRVQFCLGVAHSERGKASAADSKRHIARAINLGAESPLAYFYRGQALNYLQEWEAAAKDLSRFLKAPVAYPHRKILAHGFLGIALFCLGDHRGSLPHLTIARQSRPEYWPDVSNALASAHCRLGNYSTAALLLTAEKAKAPKNHTLGVYLVECLMLAGRFDEAVKEGFAVSRDFPEDVSSTSRITELHCLRGRYRDAARLCEKRLEEEPRCLTTLAARACLLAACPDEALRKPAQAASIAERLVRECGIEHPEVAWVAALAHGAKGEYARASAILHRLLGTKGVPPFLALRAMECLANYSQKRPYREHYRLSDRRWVIQGFRDRAPRE